MKAEIDHVLGNLKRVRERIASGWRLRVRGGGVGSDAVASEGKENAGIDHVLDNLKRVCERIASGQYDDLDDLFAMTSAADLPLVVNELAEAFASMTVQVEAREFRLTEMLADLNEANRQLAEAHRKISSENEVLRDQVQRMRIEIDVSRRDKEVSEIEGTDYFQTLRSRAQEMRGRYREKSPTTD